MRERLMTLATGIALGAALAQSLGILPAWAAGSPDLVGSFDLVPFRGHIEKNGQSYSDPVKLTFRLYALPAGGSAFYEESIFNVQPADGNFAVLLGVDGHVPGGGALKLNDALRANATAYISIAVDNGSELEGRQRLASAPFAASPYVPAGTIVAFAGVNPPTGWFLCNGASVSRTDFAELFATVGEMYGTPANGTTFKLPDFRGRFLRGNDNLAGIDPGRPLGSTQGWSTGYPNAGLFTGPSPSPTPDGAHRHRIADYVFAREEVGDGFQGDSEGNGNWDAWPTEPPLNHWTGEPDGSLDGAHSHVIKGGDAETRPVNTSVNWIIKW